MDMSNMQGTCYMWMRADTLCNTQAVATPCAVGVLHHHHRLKHTRVFVARVSMYPVVCPSDIEMLPFDKGASPSPTAPRRIGWDAKYPSISTIIMSINIQIHRVMLILE